MPSSIKLLGLTDINCSEEIPETASTICENALLKARYVYEKYRVDCFADDSGLEVQSLDGAPGVHSARYAGEQKNDAANITKVLTELSSKPDRSARFITVIALILEGKEFVFEGIISGQISHEKRGASGFGYDPVFIPEGYDKTFAEMSASEKNSISHRARAVQKLLNFLHKRQ